MLTTSSQTDLMFDWPWSERHSECSGSYYFLLCEIFILFLLKNLFRKLCLLPEEQISQGSLKWWEKQWIYTRDTLGMIVEDSYHSPSMPRKINSGGKSGHCPHFWNLHPENSFTPWEAFTICPFVVGLVTWLPVANRCLRFSISAINKHSCPTRSHCPCCTSLRRRNTWRRPESQSPNSHEENNFFSCLHSM